MEKYSDINRATQKFIGVSVSFLAIDIVARILMLWFLLRLGTSVEKMVEIDPNIAYKYSYTAVESAKQTVPVVQLCRWISIMSLSLFVLNHAYLYLIGHPYKVIAADAYHFLMVITMAGLSSIILVQALKVWVARPRPDFLSRCYPQGYDLRFWKRIPECNVSLSDPILNDGIQSFPSGHSAAAWAFSVFSFLYLKEHYKVHSRHTPSRIPRCVPFLFAFGLAIFACYVSCSRITDFQHHPEDVIAGGLIGVFLSYLSFFLYYPIAPDRRKIGEEISSSETNLLLSQEDA